MGFGVRRASSLDERKVYKEVVLKAVKAHGYSLFSASKALQADIEVVKEAVGENGLALKFASKTMRNNKEVVRIALINNADAYQFASRRLRNSTLIDEVLDVRFKLFDCDDGLE